MKFMIRMMMAAALMCATQASAQTAADPGEGLRAAVGSTSGTTAISWWGKAGRTYFVQTCVTLMEADWRYVPVVESGTEAVITWNFSSSAERGFVRLIYTDQIYTGSASDADFDNDGLTNAQEVAVNIQSNPFNEDSDLDGYSDSVEWGGGFSPTNSDSSPEFAGGELRLEGTTDYTEDYLKWWQETPYSKPVQTWGLSWSWSDHTGSDADYKTGLTARDDGPAAHPLSAAASLGFPFGWGAFPFTVSDPSGGQGDVLSYLITLTHASTLSDPKFGGRHSYAVYGKLRLVTDFPRVKALTRHVLLERYAWDAEGTNNGSSLTNGRADGMMLVALELPAGQTQGTPKLVETPVTQGQQKEVKAGGLIELKVAAPGGYVESVFEDGEKHFVTPKWAQDIDGNNDKKVVVTVKGMSKEQLSPFKYDANGVLTTEVNPAQKLEWSWQPETFTPAGQSVAIPAAVIDPTDATKLLVNREHAQHVVVSVQGKGGGTTSAKMNVWVVWCNTINPGQFSITAPVTNQAGIGAVTNVSGGLQFNHIIQPPTIITATERPNLSGPRKNPPPGTKHALFNTDLKNGANNKWDASRQFRFKHANPDNLPSHAFGQPAPLINVASFPTNTVEGNDDDNINDEVPVANGLPSGAANDPYQATSQGVLWSTDVPNFSISKGNFDEVFEYNLQMQDFPRLEINGIWYRVGDFTPWRFRVFMRKVHNSQLNIDYWGVDPQQTNPAIIRRDHNDF